MKSKEKLRVFEAFAGIGAQHSALKNLNINYEIVGVSEWFINAIKCYDCIHSEQKIDFEVPNTKKQRIELSKYTFSWDSVLPYDISRMSDTAIEDLYIANKRIKNFGSICDIRGRDLPQMDLFVYSFPCQDLSTGGKTQGMKKGSGTRSGLLWEVERILIELKELNRLPEYLLLENVPALLAESNEDDLNQWLFFLRTIGYYNNDELLLNAADFGVPQERKRVFIASSLNSNMKITMDDLEKNIDYKLSSFVPSAQGLEKWKNEYDQAQLNNTPSREYMWQKNGKEWNENLRVHTITCNMDRSNTSVMFKYSGLKGDTYRLLTIREAFLLMGFSMDEYERASTLGLSYRQMNKLIGNSIVVTVLEAIFKAMFKERYNKDDNTITD